ncbi:hypothetical protein [Halomonas caseinilytica]|uniref:Uncharacterized protein n=1 Tax=Halomonas caseinilytica TaxID=438744 RepID=A0A1M7BAK9_9GAMM|nr:hypothetical protein [Halomonas caseinilytica]SHL52020.1 hypothetical protein SAMN05192556_1207 [Halomonas caseinilytica]
MNLSELTQPELVDLIQKASAELADRMAQPEIERIPHQRPTVVMREPPAEDKAFVLRVKTMVSKGVYIKAAERRRVAAIAEDYPEWVKQQGLPTERGTSAWRDASEALHLYKPADEQ